MHIAFATGGLRFDGSSLEKGGLGGSESAMIYLARELATLGHRVEVYCRCLVPGVYDGVRYCELADLEKAGEAGPDGSPAFDVYVCSRFWKLLQNNVTARATIAWCHDMPSPEMSAVLWKVDAVAVLSEFHKQEYARVVPDCAGMLWQTENAVGDEIAAVESAPDRRRLIYASRPERGLIHLLKDIFPKILAAHPDTELHICAYQNETPPHLKMLMDEIHMLKARLGKSVIDHGALTKQELWKLMGSCGAMVYPCDFPEISCIAAKEAIACQIPVITTNAYALPETVGGCGALVDGTPGTPEYTKKFVEQCDAYRLWEWTFPYRTWSEVAKDWDNKFRDVVVDKTRFANPSVACCMIVKDEAADLLRCLRSVAPHVDEIHITDTGSKSDFVERVVDELTSEMLAAGRFIPQIEIRDCQFDNFAQARNVSISGVKTDWIFWLDADEVLIEGTNLRKYLTTTAYNGFAVVQRHLYVDVPPSCDIPVRLFRNRPEYQFVGHIHEHCEDTSRGLDQTISPVMIINDLCLAHSGYVDERGRKKKISARNIALLRRGLSEQPERLFNWFFAMRDLVHLAKWTYETEKKIDAESPAHEALRWAVGLFFLKFAADEPHMYYELAYSSFQDALALSAKCGLSIDPVVAGDGVPIQVAFGMMAARGEPVKGAEEMESTLRWFVNARHLAAHLDRKCNLLMHRLGVDAKARMIAAREYSPSFENTHTIDELLGMAEELGKKIAS